MTWSDLIRPPRLQHSETDAGKQRTATWLELFFDLAFVLVVGELAVGLRNEPLVGRAPRDVPGMSLCRSQFTCLRERPTRSRVGERLGWPWRKQDGPLGLWDGV
jgi:hypothetical protein